MGDQVIENQSMENQSMAGSGPKMSTREFQAQLRANREKDGDMGTMSRDEWHGDMPGVEGHVERPATKSAGGAKFTNHDRVDIFKSRCDWLVNPVNCLGISGVLAGVFARNYPMMEAVYWHGCKWSLLHLGSPLPYYAPNDREPNVLLFPTMFRPGSASSLADITAGLETLARRAAEWGATSIAFPMMGCGVGGLEWAAVEAEIRRILGPLDMTVELYGLETAGQEAATGDQPAPGKAAVKYPRGSRGR